MILTCSQKNTRDTWRRDSADFPEILSLPQRYGVRWKPGHGPTAWPRSTHAFQSGRA